VLAEDLSVLVRTKKRAGCALPRHVVASAQLGKWVGQIAI